MFTKKWLKNVVIIDVFKLFLIIEKLRNNDWFMLIIILYVYILMFKQVFICMFSMFNEEENDLFQDMKCLPHNSVISKLNNMGKRANTAIVSIIIYQFMCTVYYLIYVSFYGMQNMKKLMSDLIFYFKF